MKEEMPSPAELLKTVSETFGVIEDNIKMVRDTERAVEIAQKYLKSYDTLLQSLAGTSEESDQKQLEDIRADVQRCIELLEKTTKFRTESLANLQTMVGLVGKQIEILSSILESSKQK